MTEHYLRGFCFSKFKNELGVDAVLLFIGGQFRTVVLIYKSVLCDINSKVTISD